jgi:hypothetical protein
MAALLNYLIVDGSQTAANATHGSIAYALFNGTFGEPLIEEPIDFDAALAAYPTDAPLIEEPDWPLGGTPLGI